MRVCYFLLAVNLGISTLFSKEIPTQTRQEILLKLEIGTLTEKGETVPGDIVVTLKTDKQSYCIDSTYSTFPGETAKAQADLSTLLSKAASIASQGPQGGVVIHLLTPLRPDGTTDNTQANVTFYPDRNRRHKFGSREWTEEDSLGCRGLFFSKIPAALGSSEVTYTQSSATSLHLPCIIEIQEEKPEVETNSYLDGLVTFVRPPNLERLDGRNDPGDNPFSMQSKQVLFRPKDVNPSNYQAINISALTIGASIGNGKVVTFHPVSDAQLRESLIAANADSRTTTNEPKVEECMFAGQKAYKLYRSLTTHQEIHWQGVPHDKATTSIEEIYWVRVHQNQVLEIRLIAASEPLLATVREWASQLKIEPSKLN